MITCNFTNQYKIVVRSESCWVGITYDGEVFVWKIQTVDEIKEAKSLHLISTWKTYKFYSRHGSVSLDGNTIAFVSEVLDDHSLVILKLNGDKLEFLEETDIPNNTIRQWDFNQFGEIFVVSAIYNVKEINGNKRKQNISHVLSKFKEENGSYTLFEKMSIEDNSYLLYFKQSIDKKYGILVFQSRRIWIVDLNNFTIITEDKIEGIGGLKCEIYDNVTNSFIVLAPDQNAYRYTIDLNDSSVIKSEIKIVFELPVSIYNTKLLNKNLLVCLSESGINSFLLDIEKVGDIEKWVNTETFNYNVVHIAGCGVDINIKGDMIWFGDLSGRVHVYLQTINEETKQIEYKRERPFKFQHGVRSLAFHPTQKNVVMVGLMSGWIFYVDPIDDIVLDVGWMNANVTALKWYKSSKHEDKVEHILVATSSNGDVKFFTQIDDTAQFTESYSLHAHPKSNEPQNEDFGSLIKYSEVWNITLQNSKVESNHLKYFVTCSEDQTWKAWKVLNEIDENGNRKCKVLDTLKGHTRAVTDVAWFKMNDWVLGEECKNDHVFASCSDDQLVRVYRVNFDNGDPEFFFMFELDTHFIEEWHTITYLALEENGTRVAVSTQNGYLVIWDISFQNDKNVLFSRKIHEGSIEGLKWKGGKLLTISSDWTSCLIDLPQAK